jgi:two-component system, NarL family, response regulator NreC
MIRVLIADDHGLMRAGLRAMLQGDAEMEVIGDAADGDAALALAAQLRPDVVLADITMPGPDGITIARRLQQTLPHTRVLILTMHEDGNLARDALEAGAAGFIVKRALDAELLSAIRQVYVGQQYVHSGLVLSGAGQPPVSVPPTEHGAPLSELELRLLTLLARGSTNHETADALGLTLARVQELREQVDRRHGLRSRVEIARYVKNHNLAA